MRAPALVVWAAVMAVGPVVSGQEPKPSTRLAFQVTSVRPNTSGSGSVSMRRLGGGFDAVNVTPRDLILGAFDIPLEPSRAPVQVFVIDRLERPSEN